MYKFTDTISENAGEWRSSEALSLDGAFLEDHIAGYHTLTVSGRESLEYEINDDDRPTGVNGMNYYGKRMKGRELEVTFQLVASSAEELIERFRELVNFVKGENRQIRFADEPAAHYTGTIESIDAPDAGKLQTTSKMTFYCPDPALVSDVVTTVTAAESNGVLTADIENKGSATTYPTIRVKHDGENGYIGLASSDSAFEMGNIEEIDGNTYERNETLISSAKVGERYRGTSHQNPKLLVSSDEYGLDVAEAGVIYNPFYIMSSNVEGGCLKYTLPADSNGDVGAKNFYCWCGMSFVADKNEEGVEMIYFTDENDKFLFGYGIHKDNMSNTRACYTMWITNGDLTTDNNHEFMNFDFDCHKNDGSNPYSCSRGECDVMKVGSQVRFYFNRKYYNAYIPEIANSKVCYGYVYIGKWGGNAKWADMQVGMHQFYMQKMNVEKWNDIPNRYAKGSEIVIDSETDTITNNGLPANDEMVKGSEFFILPPGKSKIEIATSSWCSPAPTVTVEYRERWL